MAQSKDYLLGVNQTELDRLRFQHSVWGGVTNKFFDRLSITQGMKCLDVGSGPGFVSMDLHDRVGSSGEISALEPSEFYLEWFREETKKRGWSNIKCIHGTAETAPLPKRYYDFIFVRWVVGFVPDAEKFLAQLFASMKPGGIIAIQDYYYEGLSLFPRGGAFDGMADCVRAYWRYGGGDPYIAARIPAIFRKYNLETVDYTPNCLTGGPNSNVIEWAHKFFTTHTQMMVDKGVMDQKTGDAMVADWLAHRKNPDTIFFSPIVVDVAGKLQA